MSMSLSLAGGSRCSLRFSRIRPRSEEHTSELQSRLHLVCRLLLEKKKIKTLEHECRYRLPGGVLDEELHLQIVIGSALHRHQPERHTDPELDPDVIQVCLPSRRPR